MSEIPNPEREDPRDIDNGEMFRKDNRQLPAPPLQPKERLVLAGVAGVALAAFLFALTR